MADSLSKAARVHAELFIFNSASFTSQQLLREIKHDRADITLTTDLLRFPFPDFSARNYELHVRGFTESSFAFVCSK